MMQKRITSLVLDSFGTQSYKKAMECLKVLREESVKVCMLSQRSVQLVHGTVCVGNTYVHMILHDTVQPCGHMHIRSLCANVQIYNIHGDCAEPYGSAQTTAILCTIQDMFDFCGVQFVESYCAAVL